MLDFFGMGDPGFLGILFDTLETMKIGRNEKCPCGSGKKYKRCCLGNSGDTFLLQTFKISFEPLLNIYGDESEILQEDLITLGKISEKVARAPEHIDWDKTIEILSELRRKYPQTRRIYNVLGNCYERSGQSEKSKQITFEAYERFPDYLFARTSYVSYWMREGDYSKFEEVFSSYDIKALYPGRDIFHASEIIAFYTVCGRQRAYEGDFDTARRYADTLKELVPSSSFLDVLEKEILYRSMEKSQTFDSRAGGVGRLLSTMAEACRLHNVPFDKYIASFFEDIEAGRQPRVPHEYARMSADPPSEHRL